MNLNIKDKTKSLNRRRKIGPLMTLDKPFSEMDIEPQNSGCDI